jgi:hypothetical protein
MKSYKQNVIFMMLSRQHQIQFWVKLLATLIEGCSFSSFDLAVTASIPPFLSWIPDMQCGAENHLQLYKMMLTTEGQYVIHVSSLVTGFNTLRTGDANLRHLCFLRYSCERQMTQICLLTRAWFLPT